MATKSTEDNRESRGRLRGIGVWAVATGICLFLIRRLLSR
jgi:hypothetical protein